MTTEKKFESFVNSEECKTKYLTISLGRRFESFVNSEECKTEIIKSYAWEKFESFVNSEECKTVDNWDSDQYCLRALLIQKSVKQLITGIQTSIV